MLDALRRDHTEAGEKLVFVQMEVVEDVLGADDDSSVAAVRQAVKAFVEDMARHIAVETDWLFPAAEKRLRGRG
jgi:hemerythrin-like domain-containing protein